MADRYTTIPGDQIRDGTIKQTELDLTTPPTDGQILKVNMPAGDFTPINLSAGGVSKATVTFDSSDLEGVALFDGTYQYLTFPDHSDFDVFSNSANIYTIHFWVKIYKNNTSKGYYFIEHGSNNSNRWQISCGSTGIPTFRLIQGSNIICTATTPIDDGDWHHIACIKNGTDHGIYIDGIQEGYVSSSQTGNFTGNLYIGNRSVTAFGDNMVGKMNDVIIQNSNYFSASPNVGLTDTITVPTSTPASDANTHLRLLFDGNFTDTGNTVHTATNNGSVTTEDGWVDIDHNLGTEDVQVQVWSGADNLIIPGAVLIRGINKVTVDLSSFADINGTWKAVVIG